MVPARTSHPVLEEEKGKQTELGVFSNVGGGGRAKGLKKAAKPFRKVQRAQ